tara:strand:- start:454 stop:951 length:498 start_codon:yes stop_codon:yes gene_type:complete
MLVLLLGPSAVGKSSIMNELEYRHGWKQIQTGTTRPLRKTDKNKYSLEKDIINEDEYFVQRSYNSIYAQKRDVILRSISARDVYTLDLSHNYYDQFIRYNPLSFCICLLSLEKYVDRLVGSGRVDRLSASIDEYKKMIIFSIENNIPKIINNDIKKATEEVFQWQ